ncbi:MAG: adenylyltransferase/cytidyltransferase family protein [Deltaproteobacteria bacterium]|nr:adenylyltransferase/cytidyltransferase family protein [Deltaproteobacteria bacterium]
MDKVFELGELKKIVEAKKGEGNRVIFANGVFDILHVGHIRYLKGARELGDILVVAVNSDSSVKSYKGDDRPHTPEQERLEILSSLHMVDYIVLFSEPDVANLLLELKPHVQAKGTDYTEETVPEKDIVASYGGKVAIVGDAKDHSSTEMIEKVRSKG